LREIFLNQERSEMNGELPCISRHLTKLDAILMDDPLTDLSLRTLMLARAAYVSARMYQEDPEPIIKHLLLLSIRCHHRQFMKLPKPYSDALAPIWSKWLDVLEEEEKELANA
jgi:hypothetical protein